MSIKNKIKRYESQKRASEKKNTQLGMCYGKARNILTRQILLHLLKKLNLDYCLRCSSQIINVRDLSIDHIEPWLDNNPQLFWDLENISFSHLSCNCKNARHPKKGTSKYVDYWNGIGREPSQKAADARRVYNPQKRHQQYLRTGK